MAEQFKYRAFISYSHADQAWASWLHNRLERYRVPSRLVGTPGQRGPVSRRIGRCFRDQLELSAASRLGDALKDALRESQALIVICSPNAAVSHWVNEEIQFFQSLGKGDNIYALIVGGEPNSGNALDCFPPALLECGEGEVRNEPLAADARPGKDGKDDAFIKLAAGLLGVGFDDLRRREHRRRSRLMAIAVATLIGITAMTSVLAVSAYRARNDAQKQRQQADDLIGFMLGDLKLQLEGLGRLDLLDATVAKTMTYLRTSDGSTVADDALARRAQALTVVAELRYARGQVPEAIKAATEAVAVARALVARAPSESSEELLAAALYALGEPTLEAGDFDSTRPRTQEALAIAERLLRAAPDSTARAVLVGALSDQWGYLSAWGPVPDPDAADQAWNRCIDVLQPYLERPDATPIQLRFLVRCEAAIGVHFYRRDTQIATAISDRLMRDSRSARTRFPEDRALLLMILYGVTNAIGPYQSAGMGAKAEEASAYAIEIGRQLVAFEPNNLEFERQLAGALRTAAELLWSEQRWSQARAALDEALTHAQRVLARNPDSAETRRMVLYIYSLRAQVFARGLDERKAALADTVAGLAHLHENDWAKFLLEPALGLVLLQWSIARESDADLASQAEKLVDKLVEDLKSAPQLLQPHLPTVNYLKGRIEDGDRLSREPTWLNSWIRSEVCKLATGEIGRQCRNSPAPRPAPVSP